MDWTAVLDAPRDEAVVVDWKESGSEILGWLRRRFPEHTALRDAGPDRIVAAYVSEPGPPLHAALGQQLTTRGLLLYSLPVEADELHFVVVAATEEPAFLAAAQQRSLDVELLVQAGRSRGEPADPPTPLGPNDFPKVRLAHRDLVQVGRYAMAIGAEPDRWLDLGSWPPAELPLPPGDRVVRFAARPGSDSFAAALIEHDDDPPITLAVSVDPGNPPVWREIEIPPGAEWAMHGGPPGGSQNLADLVVLGDDLLASHRTGGTIWAVDDSRAGGNTVRTVLDPGREPGIKRFGCGVSGDGRTWLIHRERLYEWRDGALVPTQTSLRPSDTFAAVPTRAGFAFADGTRVTEVDVNTGLVRQRTLPRTGRRATLVDLGPEWALQLNLIDARRGDEIAQLWHRSTDRWFRLPFGLVGKHHFKTAVTGSDGRLWMGDTRNETLVDLGRPDDLAGALEEVDPDATDGQWGSWTPPRLTPYARTALGLD